MFLVVDANILFSFFSSDSARRKIIESSPDMGFRLISPDFVFEELARNKERIQKYAGIGETEFIILFSLLERKIETVPRLEYERFLAKAGEIAPHSKDIPYFALALTLNCPIWSDEKSFKEQDKVEVVDTKDLSDRSIPQ